MALLECMLQAGICYDSMDCALIVENGKMADTASLEDIVGNKNIGEFVEPQTDHRFGHHIRHGDVLQIDRLNGKSDKIPFRQDAINRLAI